MSKGQQNQLPAVVVVAVIAVGTVGYFLGISRDVAPQGYTRADAAPSPTGEEVLLSAPTQAELAEHLHGPNRPRLQGNLARLAEDRRAPTDDVERPTDAQWRSEVAARAERRAFAGAPPTVPHAVDQSGFPDCTACHLDGLVLEGRTAPQMSHEPIAACTQCHVVEHRPTPGDAVAGGPPAADNRFAGMARWGRGERAWPGAPRTIPHPTHMRERCESCHGVLADDIHTSHPERQGCTQCHAPSAALDQQPRTSPPPLPLASLPGDRPPPLRR